MKYYASLTGPFLGLYFPLPLRHDVTAHHARIAGGAMLNSDAKIQSAWCSIYDEAEVDRQITEFGGAKLPNAQAARLNFDWHVVHKVCSQFGVDFEAVYSDYGCAA